MPLPFDYSYDNLIFYPAEMRWWSCYSPFEYSNAIYIFIIRIFARVIFIFEYSCYIPSVLNNQSISKCFDSLIINFVLLILIYLFFSFDFWNFLLYKNYDFFLKDFILWNIRTVFFTVLLYSFTLKFLLLFLLPREKKSVELLLRLVLTLTNL